MRINFRFDVEKLVQALAFFVSRGVNDLDKMKAMKLLFLADKKHLLEYGKPITGDRYFCMPYGPVASASFNIIRDFMDVDDQVRPFAEKLFTEFFEVDRVSKHGRLRLRRTPDLDVFSESEVSVLSHVVDQFGDKSGVELSSITHDDATWSIPAQELTDKRRSVEIPFEHFLRAAGAEQMLRFVQSQQEDRDFELAITFELQEDEVDVTNY